MPEGNRNLAENFQSFKWGDPLIANIGGSSSFVKPTDVSGSVRLAMESLPFQYPYLAATSEQQAQAGNSDTVEDPVVDHTWDKIASFFSPVTSADFFTAGDLKDNVKQFSKYVLLAAIGLVIFIYGIHLVTK